MSNGFYTVAAGMMTQQRSLNTIANNMANSKTPGFKSERVVSTTFEQELLIRQEGSAKYPLGAASSTVTLVDEVASKFDVGNLADSERPFDIAIQGEGFFTVAAENGTNFLTRNGNFDIDEEGFLILPKIGRVQGEGGDIEIGSSDFKVYADGNVYDKDGKLIDKMLIQNVAEGRTLEKYANGCYLAGGEDELQQVEAPNLAQFVLEGSNVDYNNEVALMIQTQRAFQSCAKALTMMDEINQRTARIAEV